MEDSVEAQEEWSKLKAEDLTDGAKKGMLCAYYKLIELMKEETGKHAESAKLREEKPKCARQHELSKAFDFVCPECGDKYYPKNMTNYYVGKDLVRE